MNKVFPVKITISILMVSLMSVFLLAETITVTHPALIYSDYDTTFVVHVEVPVSEQEDQQGFNVSIYSDDELLFNGLTDEFGNAAVSLRIGNEGIADITVSKGSLEYSGTIICNAYIGISELEHEIPLLSEQCISVCAYQVTKTNGEMLNVPMSNIKVHISSAEALDATMFTDTDGKAEFNVFLHSTNDVSVVSSYNERLIRTDIIKPYIASAIPEALGKNNQTSIIRVPGTDTVYMVYSDGVYIMLAKSDDYGKNWYADYICFDDDYDPVTTPIRAMGINPTLIKVQDGVMAFWNNGSSIEYSIMHSPWIPVDTMGGELMVSSEIVVVGSYATSQKMSFRLINELLAEEEKKGGYDSWADGLDPQFISDTVFMDDGSIDGIIPKESPFVQIYIQGSKESVLVGCIDIYDRVVIKKFDVNADSWMPAEIISLADQKASEPSADFDGFTTTISWKVETDGGEGSEIWEKAFAPLSIWDLSEVSLREGSNNYPINRENALSSYIQDYHSIIDFREDISLPDEPATYELYSSEDSIYCIDANIRKERDGTEVLYVYTEGNAGNYRIGYLNKHYENETWALTVSEPSDTDNIAFENSSFSGIINGRFPVERMSLTLPVPDNSMTYSLSVATDDRNPHIPQIISIDNEIAAVVYGGDEKVTDIEIPQYMTSDYTITVTIDRKKGNPDRKADITLFEFESDGELITSTGRVFQVNTSQSDRGMDCYMQVDMRNNRTELVYSIPMDGEVDLKLIDVSGRVVNNIQSGILQKGTYYHTVFEKSGIYFAVLTYEGKQYKTKLINF